MRVEVHCFSTGRVRPKRRTRGLRRWLPGGWSEATLPVNVFALIHPAGVCLFDTGQTAAASEPGFFPPWHPFFGLARFELEPGDEAAAQLGRLGLDNALVRWVVLSHLHTDHVGGVGAFRAADVFVSRVEWERARGAAGRMRGYLPHRWPRGLQPTLVDFVGAAVGPFPTSRDLAGDGHLAVVPLPGHTPGHLALLARDGAGGFLCVGDAAQSAETFEAEQPTIARWCREEAVRILATHDPDAPALLGVRATA